VHTFREFMFQRLVDEAFVGNRAGSEAAIFVLDARDELVKCDFADSSELKLEEDVWKSLCDSVRAPKNDYQPHLRHNLVPFIRAVLDAPKVSANDA